MSLPVVRNLTSPQGKEVPNQYEINSPIGYIFQSYNTTIAHIEAPKINNEPSRTFLDRDKWDYSRTTLRYLCQFLNVTGKKEIEAGIKSGAFILADLNN